MPVRRRRECPPRHQPPVAVSNFSALNSGESSTDRSRIVPFGYWGENQSGPSTSTFYAVSPCVRSSLCNHADLFPQQNVQPSYRPGPSRIECSTGRFQPYGRSRTRPNEHRNAEAGPSTLAPPPIPHVGPPTPQPSGGISETTADAENQTISEEDKAPVSDFYCSHIPHVTEWSSASGGQACQAPSRPRTASPTPYTDAADEPQAAQVGTAAGEDPRGSEPQQGPRR